MGIATLYSVVGLRVDGSRAALINHASREAAEQVLSLVGQRSGYTEFRMLLEGDWPPAPGTKAVKAGRRTR